MRKILGDQRATNLAELLAALNELTPVGARGPFQERVYVTINSDSIKLQLVEETLTDGSVVYNIELSEVNS